jgi:recombinational DNA repair protein (RecF pathway)
MSHAQTFEAIVLKTYDVGEADRLCILFTRERGRVMARASGARRLKSRLGASLLPFHHLQVELKESSAGYIVTGVARWPDPEQTHASLPAFMALQEGVELLLRLVQHEGELPEVFDTTAAFVRASLAGDRHASLGYAFSLLHLLGFLPEEEEMGNFAELGAAEHAYIAACTMGTVSAPSDVCDINQLLQLKSALLEEHLQTPLKAANIASAMA